MKRRTGLFLGAGASYEAGMPLASKLIAEIKNLLRPAKLRQLNAEWQLQGAGYPDEVIEDLVGMLVRPDVHYEAALGFMEVQFRRHRLQQEHLYSLLVELVYNLLYNRQVHNPAFLNQRLSRYDGIRAVADANAPCGCSRSIMTWSLGR